MTLYENNSISYLWKNWVYLLLQVASKTNSVRILFTILFISISWLLFAQPQELYIIFNRLDSTAMQSVQKADSVVQAFQQQADSVVSLYQTQLARIDSVSGSLQLQIDSLQNLNLPTHKLATRLDSLQEQKLQKFSNLAQQVEELKSKATRDLGTIKLPPQLQEPFQKLQSSINQFSLPSISNSSLSVPELGLNNLGKMELPTLGKHLNLNNDLGNINELSNSVGSYAKDAQSLVSGNLKEVKNIDKTIEAEVMQMEGVSQLKQGSEFLPSGRLDSAALAEKATAVMKEQVMEVAQDHFAGKEAVLQQAMTKMTKLKSRYSEIKSFAELPARLPNPLKDKPFIERLVPGISFQMQKTNYLLLDIAPMLMYKISPRFSAGAGWNERLPIGDFSAYKEQRIYGPRAAVEFKWTEGMNLRFLPELMNTTIPPYAAQVQGINDPAYRTWIAGLFIGIKKDFKVYKTIEGNTEVLYNLYDPKNMSPYAERFSLRFGFEFPMKKKVKPADQ